MECDIIDRTEDIVAVAPTRVLTLLQNRGHCCNGYNKGADIITEQDVRNNTNEMVQPDKIMTDYCSFYFTTYTMQFSVSKCIWALKPI